MSLFKKKEKEKTAEEWFTLGNEEDDPDKQLEYYTKALDINPKFVLVWNIKGQALDNLGRCDEAIVCYDKAQEINPKDATSWNLKGIALRSLGRHDEARACFGRALNIDPDYDSAKNNFKTLIGELTTEERYELLREAVDREDVEHITAEEWFDKGSDLYEMGRYDEAITCLDKVLDIYPENTEVWHNKGIALSGLGRHDKAITCFDKALEIDPSNELARNSREHAVRELKEENIDEKRLEGNPDENYLTKLNLELFEEGTNLLEGDPIEAIEVFEKRINDYPNESILWCFMGKAYAKIGDDIKSLEYCDRAIELEPQNFIAWKEKGLLLSNKNPHEAIKCFDKSIELYEDAQVWFYKGLVLASYLGEHEEAIHCLSKSLETEYEFIQDWHYAAWYQRGFSLYELDEYEEAIVCFDKAIEIDPNMEEAWTGKGKSLLKLGKIDESDECLYFINKIRESKSELHEEGVTNEETIRKQISTFNSEINHLAKDRTKKFSEAGELAYSDCIENTPKLASDAQTELDNILAIDTLISKTNQEMEKAKGGKKKTGFLGKLGDTVSSVAKQGKLKVESYNLERKKKSTITDFGEALWESHKSGDDTLQELSDIWQTIDDIEQQIHKNEEEIDNLNELLR